MGEQGFSWQWGGQEQEGEEKPDVCNVRLVGNHREHDAHTFPRSLADYPMRPLTLGLGHFHFPFGLVSDRLPKTKSELEGGLFSSTSDKTGTGSLPPPLLTEK